MASTLPGEPPSSTVGPAASSERARGSGGPRLRGRRGSEGPATVAVLEAIAEEPRYTNAATSGSAAVAAQPARRLEDFVTDTELIDDVSRRLDRAIKQRESRSDHVEAVWKRQTAAERSSYVPSIARQAA